METGYKMTTKIKIAISAVSLVTAFAFGRWEAPEKIVTKTVTVEVDKKVQSSDIDTNRHKESKIVEVVKPDGTKETTTTVSEDTNREAKTHETNTASKSTQSSKETTNRKTLTTISFLGGISDFGTLTKTYGLGVTKPVLGPITIGVWGLSSGIYGASIGLTF